MDRTFGRLAPLALPLLLLVPGALALHEPAVRVSLAEGVRVETSPLLPTLRHAADPLLGPAEGPAAADARPAASEEPTSPQEAAPAPRDDLRSALLAGLALAGVVLLLLVLAAVGVVAALSRGDAKRRAEERARDEKLKLCRLAAEASMRRAVALAEENARLREEAMKGRPASPA